MVRSRAPGAACQNKFAPGDFNSSRIPPAPSIYLDRASLFDPPGPRVKLFAPARTGRPISPLRLIRPLEPQKRRPWDAHRQAAAPPDPATWISGAAGPATQPPRDHRGRDLQVNPVPPTDPGPAQVPPSVRMWAGPHRPTEIKRVFFENVSPIWRICRVFGGFAELVSIQPLPRGANLQKPRALRCLHSGARGE